MKKVIIANKQQLTDKAYILSLSCQPPFVPGQVIELTEDISLPPRMYSICNAPGNSTLDVLFDVKEEGRLTPVIAGLTPGQSIYVGEPRGNFICPPEEKAFWIASGTGIAPFVSMFLSGNTKNKYLVHGGRTLESFYFSEYFLPILKSKYIRCCTGEKAEGLYYGRLTGWLTEQVELPLDFKYYLCGSAEMVVQTRDILVSKGISFERIMAEIYF